MEEKFHFGTYSLPLNKKETVITITATEIDEINIVADQTAFEHLCEHDDFEFKYGIYAPEFYARSIPFNGSNLTIDKSSTHETALYFEEHNFADYELNIDQNHITIQGVFYIGNENHPFTICVKIERD